MCRVYPPLDSKQGANKSGDKKKVKRKKEPSGGEELQDVDLRKRDPPGATTSTVSKAGERLESFKRSDLVLDGPVYL